MTSSAPHIAVIGGGTGSFTLLGELKNFTPHLTAIVNMSDDGGSTGQLRDEYGVLPPGDIRQCLVALSDAPEVRDLFSYRFGDGAFAGHSLGNVMLSGLELRYGSFEKAVEVASAILGVTGQVLPVSLDKSTLAMQDGPETIRGEHLISQRPISNRDARVYLEPEAHLNPKAAAAIAEADLVVIAPGNLYGSLLPALVVSGIKEALQQTKARLVMVSNLVNKPGQTDGWHVADYVRELERYIGPGEIDVVLYNKEPPSPALLEKYAAQGELPVDTAPLRFGEIKAKAIGADLVSDEIATQDSNDKAIRRTLIRHDARAAGAELMQVYRQAR